MIDTEYEKLFEKKFKQRNSEIIANVNELQNDNPDWTEDFLRTKLTDQLSEKLHRLFNLTIKDRDLTFSNPNYYLEEVCRSFYAEYSKTSITEKYKANKVINFIKNDLEEIKIEILSRFENKNPNPLRKEIKKSIQTKSNKQLIEIVAEYCVYQDYLNRFATSSQDFKGVENIDSVDIRWTGDKTDLLKIIYAAYKSGQINNGEGRITEISGKILNFFNLTYRDKDNSLSNSIWEARKNGYHQYQFAIDLKKGFREYLRSLPSMVDEDLKYPECDPESQGQSQ